jgi:hypothetical protein
MLYQGHALLQSEIDDKENANQKQENMAKV